MKKTSRLLVDIFLIITILLCILPFLYMILMSLKSTVNAYDFDFALSKLTLKYPVCFLHYLQAVLLVLHLRN